MGKRRILGRKTYLEGKDTNSYCICFGRWRNSIGVLVRQGDGFSVFVEHEGPDERTTMTASVTQEQMRQNVFHHTLTVPLSLNLGGEFVRFAREKSQK